MASEQVYSSNAYMKELETSVHSVVEGGVILESTIFYPQGGGQPSDKGKLTRLSDKKQFTVTDMKKDHGELIHLVEGEIDLHPGDKVLAEIDWDYRYKLMKHHTTLHVLSAVVFRNYEAKVTGGTIYENKARLDFDLQEFNKELAADLVQETNEELKKDHQVSVEFISREEANKRPELIRTKVNLLPDSIKTLRLVKIGDVDIQADGGLHVKSTKEIGDIQLVKVENKGKGRKRITVGVV